MDFVKFLRTTFTIQHIWWLVLFLILFINRQYSTLPKWNVAPLLWELGQSDKKKQPQNSTKFTKKHIMSFKIVKDNLQFLWKEFFMKRVASWFFSCEFCVIFQINFFIEQFRATVSSLSLTFQSNVSFISYENRSFDLQGNQMTDFYMKSNTNNATLKWVNKHIITRNKKFVLLRCISPFAF